MTEPLTPIGFKTKFTRSNLCRTIRVDGSWGGVTPTWGIHMALFNERWELPEGTAVKPNDQGVWEDFPEEIRTYMRREIEVDVLLSEDAAKSLRDWLDMMIKRLHEMRAQVQQG